ncbi:MAG TPA: glycosyltransferase [Acidobacteriaceae bacterium]|jgi:glycogen(starch) synthase|nr:glycosyltransferase [Acidobacteriaceae bacterium]
MHTAANPESTKPGLRILYAVGPGDVVGQYRDLLANKPPEFQIGMSFSMQFMDWCDAAGAVAHLVSWHGRADQIEVGPHRMENLPKPALYYGSGVKHHIGAMLYGLTILKLALQERPDVLIIDSGTTHWIVLALLAIFRIVRRRIPVIAVIHNTLWPMGFPPQRRLDRLLRSVDGFYFRHFAAATVAVSPECERQIRQVTGTPKGPIYQCRAQYRHGFLDRVSPVPSHQSRPFRTLFLGRIEENKGVFLILAVAERLEKELPSQFAWRIVGSGSAAEALARQVEDRKLGHVVRVEGRIPDEAVALETFGWAHAMIVPTTSEFCEALPMVAAESILAGRPVVVSTVVPAWEVLDGAAIKAETDSVESFVEAFRKLALDSSHYESCRQATLAVQAQFYDASNGLGNVIGRAIAKLNH